MTTPPKISKPLAAWTTLAVILIAAAALRLYRLTEVPPGAFIDEAAIGANAYALGRTGRNLAGQLLPLFSRLDPAQGFEGIVDRPLHQQPLYQFAAVPFVRLFGLSLWSVRLTSVFFGVLGVAATFVLARRFYGMKVGLAAAGFLAISPWHLHFSRVGFEAISLTPLLAMGIYCLHRGAQSRGYLILGAALMALATYAYPAARLFVPILLLGYAAIYRGALRARPRPACLALALFLLIVTPNAFSTLFGSRSSRARTSTILNEDLDSETVVRFLKRHSRNPAAEFVLDHRAALVPYLFAHNYLSYLMPRYLFVIGDSNRRHSLYEMGMLHAFYLPLLIVGVASLIRARGDRRNRLLLFWLFTYPIPGAIATAAPHAIRSFHAMPMLEIVAAVGLAALVGYVRGLTPARSVARRRAAAALLALTILAAAIQLPWYLATYHGKYADYAGCSWNEGLGEAIEHIESIKGGHELVYMSHALPSPYLYVLLFGEIDWDELDLSADRFDQLKPFQYELLRPGEEPPGLEGSGLFLIHPSEASRYRDLPLVESFECGEERRAAILLSGPANAVSRTD